MILVIILIAIIVIARKRNQARRRTIAHPLNPFSKRNCVLARNVEGVGEDGDRFAPGLTDGVIDVVDGIGDIVVCEDEVSQGGGDEVDGGPGE